MLIELIEKLRKAPLKVREQFLAFWTIAIVAIVTLVWFGFFILSLISKGR